MKNILLVFGGNSFEHDISVVSASQIYNKTDLKDFKLIPLYISRDNKFFVYKSEKIDIKDFSRNNFNVKNKKFKEVAFISGEKGIIFAKSKFGLKEFLQSELAIFACHGGDGENGNLVAFFEQNGIYSSAGDIFALGVCMNKYKFKKVMQSIKVPAVKGFLIKKDLYTNNKEYYKFNLRFLKFPVIIKSNNGGSSIGVFIVKKREEFDDKLKMAFEFDDEVLVEKFISNVRELNVAVIGDDLNLKVSDIDEPLKENELLSFADKYLSGNGKNKNGKISSIASQKRNFPADLPKEIEENTKHFAMKIFKSLGLRGVVRIDFLYDEEKSKIYVCEVNSIPGSLAYYFFKENMIRTNDLVLRLIQIADNFKNQKFVINSEYSTNILD